MMKKMKARIAAEKSPKMFEYIATRKSGKQITVITSGDPSDIVDAVTFETVGEFHRSKDPWAVRHVW